ncbi:hypothetical protein WOLCODRAFT_135512 [Wolfiporia cocos MD-104 SS10]|uniref:Uncharacterized protein n=1 Tax=Wolfiporia cocos (strain MD-104) TaxID=742152 RepID=A0A2H3IVX7_WOLCO|nr:hypothetical protein WOLCODRAFT_135512 [Wolfiporia cocos MD-104 SS10]
MLSILTRNVAARVWAAGGRDEPEWISSSSADGEPEASVYVDVELNDLLGPLTEAAWNSVADACSRTVAPMYRAVRSTLHNDLTQLAAIVEESPSDLAFSFSTSGRSLAEHPNAGPDPTKSSEAVRPPRKRRRSTVTVMLQDASTPTVIPGSDPSIPTIVITPCPSQPREPTCLIPFQDALFGNRLTVPTHPVLNDAFPPLVAKPSPLVKSWRYESGHWWAVLPDPEEQTSRGMFSRPFPTRRQKACAPRRTPRASPRQSASSN